MSCCARLWRCLLEVSTLRHDLPCLLGKLLMLDGGQFVFLAWVTVDDEAGVADMLRRAKLMFADIPPEVLAEALRGGPLTARLRLATAGGRPLCGRVRPPLVTWSAARGGPGGLSVPDGRLHP